MAYWVRHPNGALGEKSCNRPIAINSEPCFKLYIITRRDLSPGARAAQSCHALRAFIEAHPEIDRDWYEKSNNLVVLEAENEGELYALSLKARVLDIPYAVFREPDFDNTITAISMSSKAKKLVSKLPLALQNVA